MICPKCGHNEISTANSYCPLCGEPISATDNLANNIKEDPLEGTWESTFRGDYFSIIKKTVTMVLTNPTKYFRNMPKETNLVKAIGYGVLFSYLGSLIGQVISFLINLIPMSVPIFLKSEESFNGSAFLFRFLISITIMPMATFMGLLIAVSITHFMLFLLKGNKYSIATTIKVFCYTQSVQIFCVVPILGAFVSVIWGLVTEIIGLKEAHETSYQKSIAAVILPIFLFCCCACVIFTILLTASCLAADKFMSTGLLKWYELFRK